MGKTRSHRDAGRTAGVAAKARGSDPRDVGDPGVETTVEPAVRTGVRQPARAPPPSPKRPYQKEYGTILCGRRIPWQSRS